MYTRKPNLFEKALLVVGIAVLMAGYGFIHWQIVKEGLNSSSLILVFLWLMLVALIIIAAANENLKEEMKQLIEVHLQETRMIREELRRK